MNGCVTSCGRSSSSTGNAVPIMYRALLKLGAPDAVAKQVAVNSRRWWRNSDRLLKSVLTIAYFDRLGVPRLS